MEKEIEIVLKIIYDKGFRYITKDVENFIEIHKEEPEMDWDGYWISKGKKEFPIKKNGSVRNFTRKEEICEISKYISNVDINNVSQKDLKKSVLSILGPCFRWIVRDKNGTLIVAETKPHKVDRKPLWFSDKPFGDITLFSDLFPTIKWEDNKPKNLQKLMDEVKGGLA